jgi:hypothetical protein
MIGNDALEFYNQNKNCTWKLEPLPSGTILEKARWILNSCNFGWIELDLDIDINAWQLDMKQADNYFVPHREDNNAGWNSCCIHGISVESTGAWTNYGYTDETQVPYHWTELAHKVPAIQQFWQDQFPCDHYRRVRFMELESNCAITPHSDMPGRLPGEQDLDLLEFGVPINIAISHPDECYMVLKDHGVVPFKAGKMFIVNIRNYHSVINFSNSKRVHVIGHSYGYGKKKEEFADLLVRSYEKMEMKNV